MMGNPWKVEVDGVNWPYVYQELSHDPYTCRGICTMDGEGPEYLEMANLIAEAPKTAAERDRLKAVNAELLEALKSIHDRLKPFRVTYQHQSERDALRWAEEAIAKYEEMEESR